VIGVDVYLVFPPQPLCQLGRRPGARRPIDELFQLLQMCLADLGGPPRTWSVWQQVKAPGQEGFDILTHRLFMVTKMLGDAGDAPASIRQPDHLQPVSGLGRQSSFTSVLQNDELTEGDVSLGAWQKRVTMLSAMWSGRINGK